jgi:uncharacterized protein (DUF608 family)
MVCFMRGRYPPGHPAGNPLGLGLRAPARRATIPAMTLFPVDSPRLSWSEFPADAFPRRASGVVYRLDASPCCGVPLGGLATGCIDLDARGIYGWSSAFNPVVTRPIGSEIRLPRRLPRVQAVLGFCVGGKAWVLAQKALMDGGETDWCTEPGGNDGVGKIKVDRLPCPRVEDAGFAKEIHYWGHYPVADLEYETDAPVTVGMRAWAPFIPGDAAASNIPGIVFEVHVRNPGTSVQRVTLGFNFPGPDPAEAGGSRFTRHAAHETVDGMLVAGSTGVQYFLGTLGQERARYGAGLHSDPRAWSRIWRDLPVPSGDQDASCSAAVDIPVPAGQERVVRFVLSWYAPVREAQTLDWPGKPRPGAAPLKYAWVGEEPAHFYTHMYAARFRGALDVARKLSAERGELLRRVLSWQAAVYDDTSLPAWLRDSLVNNLALVAETSYWAQPLPPLGDWAFPMGAFALDESPRGCPHMACIPCDWYGTLPITFFFPELARQTLRAFTAYQKPDGEIPFALGTIDLPDFAAPDYSWQVSLNGFCYVDLVDRLWQSTGDASVLHEFYPAVKRNTVFSMGLSARSAPAIRMADEGGMEWFEFGEWAGWTAHAGGLRLAGLLVTERMALAAGDREFAGRCRAWFDEGSRAMEDQMWTGSYYLNYLEPETGKKSDDVMGYQLDGEWTARFHGLPGVFPPKRVETALETIRRCNVALTPEIGAANFARPDAQALDEKAQVAFYGRYTMFTPELLVLAYTYILAGKAEFGIELARKNWANLVLAQRHAWDTPNMVDGRTGKRHFGTDYGQNMMLWAFPAALAGQDLRACCGPGSLVRRILQAAAT